MENDLMKILVVDDTVVYRQLLSKIVSDFENAEVIGTAPNGKIALSKIELKQPDLVLLDVFMPVMDGLKTLDQIKKQHPHIDVVMLSGMDKELVHVTMKALEAGALDFVPKPQGVSVEANMAELRAAISRLILMARTRKYS
ncbi:MAG: chemotaxis response regulator protein-glutamate methylesterase, partial [Deltaproteobacteria bacterium]